MTTGRPTMGTKGGRGGGAPKDTSPPRSEAPPEAPPEDRQEQDGTATWVQSTDATGTVKSTREVPEPDSLGG